jgi:hypothetical protein
MMLTGFQAFPPVTKDTTQTHRLDILMMAKFQLSGKILIPIYTGERKQNI